jgi:hypothetical protein
VDIYEDFVEVFFNRLLDSFVYLVISHFVKVCE